MTAVFATVTIPTVNPSAYGDTILHWVAYSALPQVLPFAAAFTAFAVGLKFITSWVGRASVRSIGGHAPVRDGVRDRIAAGDRTVTRSEWRESHRARARRNFYDDHGDYGYGDYE